MSDNRIGVFKLGTFEDFSDCEVFVVDTQKDIQRLECDNKRLKELYESALDTINRLQSEREGLISRVERALLGIDFQLEVVD